MHVVCVGDGTDLNYMTGRDILNNTNVYSSWVSSSWVTLTANVEYELTTLTCPLIGKYLLIGKIQFNNKGSNRQDVTIRLLEKNTNEDDSMTTFMGAIGEPCGKYAMCLSAIFTVYTAGDVLSLRARTTSSNMTCYGTLRYLKLF